MKLQPQTVAPTEQAGNWFKIQMNGTEKWIYAPSATFEGTKATLFEKKFLWKIEAPHFQNTISFTYK